MASKKTTPLDPAPIDEKDTTSVEEFVGEPRSKGSTSKVADEVQVNEMSDAPKAVAETNNNASMNNNSTYTTRPMNNNRNGTGMHRRTSLSRPSSGRSSYGNGGGGYSSNRPTRMHSGREEMSRDLIGDDFVSPNTPTEEVKGFLDIQPEGHGFLRPKFIPSARDIYISQSQIRRFSLRPGDMVEGVARPPKDTERYYGLLKVEKVNEVSADESSKRPYFDDLTPIYPKQQVLLATGKTPFSTRMIDLVAPIGFGQRGMIVSPPKAGKTTILKEIAAGISQNFPKVHLMAALIGERPEEVTDISMSVKGEVVASNFDEPPENQTRVAEITLDRAKRMVEMGKDVVVLLDSITRLARAYNLSVAPSGRTLSGGFDPAALWPAKKFFGAARNCEEGGSLTIIGTALVDTGSRMDDLIYEEFKGTGNMELHLDRRLAERRIFPSINAERSGTRQEELILSETTYKRIVTLRRMIDMMGPEERTAILIEKLSQTEDNEEFLATLGK